MEVGGAGLDPARETTIMYKRDFLYIGAAMNRMNASEARSDLAEVLNRVAYGGERIVLHRRGKDVAAIVPIADLALIEQLEERIDLEDARAALREVRKKGSKSLSKVMAELGIGD
jgi:prevent-host-death family protein